MQANSNRAKARTAAQKSSENRKTQAAITATLQANWGGREEDHEAAAEAHEAAAKEHLASPEAEGPTRAAHHAACAEEHRAKHAAAKRLRLANAAAARMAAELFAKVR